ncbi:MAG: DUF3326 domain-containing protein [Nanoarchaeota archaeon]|nr:DUF3326 domain-containing protein [Nanoarchaeota archaeon]
MNVVLIVPTGIGAEIGGHSGDANPVAKLIGKCCDKLITHPNVVNGSDINEMPENTLYVEGSVLDRFLRGEIFLKEVFYNKILLVVNKPINNDTINAVNAARVTIGANIKIIELNTTLEMTGFYKNGKADGKVNGFIELVEQIKDYDFDALAIHSNIKVERETKLNYLKNGGVNPWGGIEAITSKLIADKIDRPVAHSPFIDWAKGDDLKDFNEVVDPRMSAEMVSICYLHCVLKGLHRAPIIDYNKGLSVDDIDFLITPINCVGEPHIACIDADIKIIAVKENKTVLNDKMPDSFIVVDNYIEAAGLLMAYKAGVACHSVRRPLCPPAIG